MSTLQFTDSRFDYLYDNPFPNKALLEKFKKYILSDAKSFSSGNWLEDSRSFKINTINETLHLQPKLKDNTQLYHYTTLFLKDLENTQQNILVPDLTNYIFTSIVAPQIPAQESQVTTESINDNQTTDIVNVTETNPYQYDTDNFEYTSTDEITTYNLMSGKQLTYTELCKLTLSIARSQSIDAMTRKDPSAEFAEAQEKTKLKKELDKYLKNVDLAKNCDVDPNSLSIKQLQYYVDRCKDDYENLKIFNTIKKGINLSEAGYAFAFPNGIKIPGKNKAIKLDGVASGFMELMADRTSTDGIAFKNIIEKHNWHISDETCAVISILDSVVRRIKVVDIEPVKKDEEKSEESDSSDSTFSE